MRVICIPTTGTMTHQATTKQSPCQPRGWHAFCSPPLRKCQRLVRGSPYPHASVGDLRGGAPMAHLTMLASPNNSRQKTIFAFRKKSVAFITTLWHYVGVESNKTNKQHESHSNIRTVHGDAGCPHRRRILREFHCPH